MADIFRAADDLVRLAANGITFGLADRAAAALGETDSKARTAAAADRAGFAGDVAQVLGVGGGLKAIAKVGVPAVKAIPKVAKAAVSKKGALAGALGLGALVNYNSRTQPKAQAAQPRAQAKAAPRSTGKRGTGNADAVSNEIMASLKAVDSQPLSFQDTVAQLAAAQGGQVSMRQIDALSDVFARTSPKAAKPLSPRDDVTRRLQSYYDAQLEAGLINEEQWAAKYQDMMKLDPFADLYRGRTAEDQ